MSSLQSTTTACSNCHKDMAKSYTCKLCKTEVCSDCLASGKIIGTKKCKNCCTPPSTPSTPEKTPSSNMFTKATAAVMDTAKAVGIKTAATSGAVATGAVEVTKSTAGSVSTGAKVVAKSTSGAVGAVATGAVDVTKSTAGVVAKSTSVVATGAADVTKATVGGVGKLIKVGSSFDANEKGLLDMNDATMKFGWDLYALLNVTIIEASGLRAADTNLLGRDSSDPYCVVTLVGDNISRKTKIKSKTLHPVWNHECTTMVVDEPCQMMKVVVFDDDIASSDDILGTAMIDLTHLIPGEPSSGWVPLEFEGAPGGAVHLELEIVYTAASERIAFVQEAMVPDVWVEQKFNINELYGPGMFIADVLWFGLLESFVFETLLPIVMWENWAKSLLVTVGWIYASYYVSYWPAVACWLLAGCMLRNKAMKGYDRFMANRTMTSTVDKHGKVVLLDAEEDNSDANPSEQNFNGLIKTFTRMSPGWVKDLAAQFQPLARMLADGVAMAREVILWRHELSKPAFFGLLVAGVALCIVPFWLLVMGAGAGVLLVQSPLKGLSIGLAKSAARPTPTGDVGLLDSMEEHHMSQDYKKIVLSRKK